MSDTVATFLLTWLLWWAILTIVYGLLLGVNALLTLWAHRRRALRQLGQELARIDREADASVRRIGAAFIAAQRVIREEAAADPRVHR